MEKGVFISYSHMDGDNVRELVSVIRDYLHISVWYDHNLHGGDHYFSVIAEKIMNYEYFIFVVSRNSVASEFCTMELEFAKSEKRKILAVWLEDFMPPPRIRMVISHTHYIRVFALTDEELRKELQQALEGNQLASDVTVENTQMSERLIEGYKYFIKDEEKRKIKYLLQLESQGKYSSCYEPDSAVLLGLAYELGIHTDTDLRQAEYYYRVAAHKGSQDGEYLNLALLMEQGKTEIPAAVRRMYELAESGSLLAMVYWGDDLYNGRYGMRVDKETAYRWWKAAAARHHPEAQYYMAFGYRSGEVGVTDPLLAMMYAKEAEEAKFPRAHRLQGFLYRHGQFVEKDPDKAIECFNKAIQMGDLLSLNYIGDVEWFRDNFELATEYYRKAVSYADAGKIKSGAPYYNLGFSFRKGKGAKKDPRMAVEMYLKGAERNHENSKKWAAIAIHEDLTDPEEKCELLKRASELNCRRAEYYLGRLLESREDLPKSRYDMALEYFIKGMDKGDVDCMRAVMGYYSLASGKEGYRDRNKALAAMRLFFSLWNEDSEDVADKSAVIINIAYYYYIYSVELGVDEEGGKPDKELSLFYLKKALDTEYGMNVWGVYAKLARGHVSKQYNQEWLVLDPEHARAMADELYRYLPRFCEECHEQKEYREELDALRVVMTELEKYYRAQKPGLFGGRQQSTTWEENAIRYGQYAREIEKRMSATK